MGKPPLKSSRSPLAIRRRVWSTDDLTTPLWTPLDRDFVAANPSVSITDHLTVAKRFYRVQILD